ncbi:MAG: right-handed parallel beta-helix repeat-containing protein, partial [Candidatus Woesearchaeota archaeon]
MKPNNKSIGLVFVMLAFIALFSQISISALSCYISDTCDASAAAVLYLSNETAGYTNAHAELPSEASYAYKVCCNFTGGTIGTQCDATASNAFLKLANVTNSHVQQPSVDTYTHDACINVSGAGISCTYPTAACSASETCLATMASDGSSNATNAHLSQCTSGYDTRICCQAGCEIPVNRMEITSSKTFCPGTYNIPGGMTITASNIYVHCLGTVINDTNGGGTSAFTEANRDNITIYGCKIQNFGRGISTGTASDNLTFYNNTFLSNTEGIYLSAKKNVKIFNNNFTSNTDAIEMTSQSGYINITNNTFTSNSAHSIYVSGASGSSRAFISWNKFISNYDAVSAGGSSSNYFGNATITFNNMTGGTDDQIYFVKANGAKLNFSNNYMKNNIGGVIFSGGSTSTKIYVTNNRIINHTKSGGAWVSGVQFNTFGEAHIINNTINRTGADPQIDTVPGSNVNRISIIGNNFRDGANMALDLTGTDNATVKNNFIKNMTTYGVSFPATSTTTASRNFSLSNNTIINVTSGGLYFGGNSAGTYRFENNTIKVKAGNAIGSTLVSTQTQTIRSRNNLYQATTTGSTSVTNFEVGYFHSFNDSFKGGDTNGMLIRPKYLLNMTNSRIFGGQTGLYMDGKADSGDNPRYIVANLSIYNVDGWAINIGASINNSAYNKINITNTTGGASFSGYAKNITLKNSIIKNIGTNQGIYLYRISNGSFANISIKNLATESGVLLRQSQQIIFKNITINNITADEGFETYTSDTCNNITVRDSMISNVSNYGFLWINTNNSKVINTRLSSITGNDARVSGNYAVDFLNVTMTEGDYSVASSGKIKRSWYVDVQVNHSSGAPVPSASIKVNNTQGSEVATGTANAQGFLNDRNITGYQWSNGYTYYGPHKYWASNGTASAYVTQNVTYNKKVNITFSNAPTVSNVVVFPDPAYTDSALKCNATVGDEDADS